MIRQFIFAETNHPKEWSMERSTHTLLVTPRQRIWTQRSSYLDFLMRDIAEQRDLPEYKRKLAEERYNAVASWLDQAPDSDPLSKIPIKIYTIGSFLSSTPVKPQTGDEFDVDMGGELQLDYREYPDPRAAVDIFEKRIRKNKKYDEIAERKTRVIRLNYSGDFHLDFMPCFPADLNNKNSTAIKIPHKLSENLYVYKDSDPIGLNLWFERQCQLRFVKAQLSERHDNEITPFPEHQNNKPPLKLALQMLKNARNLYFIKDEEGLKDVSTVILKVLIARKYSGEQNVFHILSDAIGYIYSEFYLSDHPVIKNPINDDEDFAEKWRSDPNRVAFKKFKGFLHYCWELLNQIEMSEGDLSSVAGPLKKLFGEEEVNQALDRIGKLVTSGAKKGLVGVTSAGVLTSKAVAGTTKLRGHDFYGTN